jgi:hypothetical protein
MTKDFKYITVLDYESGQVYLYDYDFSFGILAEDFVSNRHNLDNVHYMVHKNKPQLYAKSLTYGG